MRLLLDSSVQHSQHGHWLLFSLPPWFSVSSTPRAFAVSFIKTPTQRTFFAFTEIRLNVIWTYSSVEEHLTLSVRIDWMGSSFLCIKIKSGCLPLPAQPAKASESTVRQLHFCCSKTNQKSIGSNLCEEMNGQSRRVDMRARFELSSCLLALFRQLFLSLIKVRLPLPYQPLKPGRH